MQAVILQYAVPIALLVLLVGSVEAGALLARRVSQRGTGAAALDSGAVQGAMLGLLGLLLGFSFAGASGRYMERQDLITTDANAIETAYLRADLLDEPHRGALQSELAGYAARRVERSATLHIPLTEDEMRQIADAQHRIWDAAVAGVAAKPAVTVAVLNPINEIFDVHTARVAASLKHLPGLVLALLLACCVLTLGTIGYASASSGSRNAMLTRAMALLIGAALWTTIDLDHPRIGLIRLGDATLSNLRLGE